MYQRLEELMGADDAATLMDHLPHGGWGDVARQRDLLELEQRVDARFERLELRIENTEQRLRAELHTTLRSHLLAITTANTALVGLAIAASQLH
jgi:type II secretory pathway predicted ATPase ExeA